MSILVAAVVALSLVCAFNTFLCFAVITRLRAVSAAPAAPVDNPFGGPPVGHRIGDFATTDIHGGPLTIADLRAPTVVLFLATECEPCRTERAALIDRHTPLAANAIVFVYGDSTDPAAVEFATGLPDGVRVAFVTDENPVIEAFGGVHAYPTLLRIEHAKVTVVGPSLDAVADPLVLDRI